MLQHGADREGACLGGLAEFDQYLRQCHETLRSRVFQRAYPNV